MGACSNVIMERPRDGDHNSKQILRSQRAFKGVSIAGAQLSPRARPVVLSDIGLDFTDVGAGPLFGEEFIWGRVEVMVD